MARSRKPKPRIIATRQDAAAALGVTERTLARWVKEPWWPADAVQTTRSGRHVNWNIDRIKAAVEAQGRKSSDLDDAAKALQLRKQQLQVEQLELETRKRLRAEQQDLDNILPRDELTTAIREAIVITRDHFLSLPKRIAPLIPPKQRRRVMEEVERLIRRDLDSFADMVQKAGDVSAGG